MGVSDTPKEKRFEGRRPTPSQNMQLQIAAKPPVLCCRLANTDEQLDGDSTFCHIYLVSVYDDSDFCELVVRRRLCFSAYIVT